MTDDKVTYIKPGTKMPKANPGSFGSHTLRHRMKTILRETDDPEWANEAYYLLLAARECIEELQAEIRNS